MSRPPVVIGGPVARGPQGPEGPPGPPGLPGADGIPTAEAIVDHITLPGPAREAIGQLAIDRALPTVESLVPGEVEAAVAGHVPGSSLAYIEQEYPIGSTKVAPDADAILGMIATVTGAGRRVEIEVYFPEFWHSEVGTRAIVAIVHTKGGVYQGFLAMHGVPSISATKGVPTIIKRQIVLEDGVEYSFWPAITGEAAGTTSMRGDNLYNHPYISVVTRQ